MLEIKNNSTSVANTIGLSRALGHRVLGKNGDDLGKVRELAIDPKKLVVAGIWIDPCLTCAEEYIGREYIDTISENGVLLKINPVTGVIGKLVFDSKGKKLGKISRLSREKKTNSIISIEVNQGIGKEKLLFSIDDIKTIGESVILTDSVKKK